MLAGCGQLRIQSWTRQPGLGNPPSTCTHGPPASILAPQVLRQVYQTEIRRDLVEDIKSEASGMYEKVR